MQVLFGGVAGGDVRVISPERLLVLVPPSPLPITRPLYGIGPVSVLARNLTAAGIPIAGETAVLTNGFTYERVQLADESNYTRITRQLIRVFRQQVIANVSSGEHADYDMDAADILSIVDVPDVPALVFFGPQTRENFAFSEAGSYYGQQQGYEADRFRGAETDDLIYSFVGITDQKQEALGLQSLVRQFFKNNKWLFLDRDPNQPDKGQVHFDLVLDTSGIGFNPPSDQKSSLRSFSGTFLVRGFNHEALPGFPLSDRVDRTHVVLPASELTLSEKAIVSFEFPNGVGVIGDSTISVSVPFGTDLTALIPTILHSGASVSPSSGVAADFTSPVTFTVTAQDGSTKAYVVTVNVASETDAEITAFLFAEGAGLLDGTLIDVIVPTGTDRTALVPAVAIVGLSVAPVSGAPEDFSAATLWSWDATAAEAFKTYTHDGDTHRSYVGSAPTIAARLGLIASYNLAGVALWVLGREDKRIYQRLREYFGGSSTTDLVREVAGWYNDGWNAESHASYIANSDVFSEINPYWYDVGAQGNLTLADGTVSERAYAYTAGNITDAQTRADLVIPTVADHGQIATILANPTARLNLQQNLISVVASRGYDGIDLNFESGGAPSKAEFTAFVTSLAGALHLMGKRLVVTMRPAASPSDESGLLFDYAALGASPVDRLKIMAYDNFAGGTPEPTQAIAWIRSVLDHAITTRGIPSSKIQLALGMHAWTWRDNLGSWELQEPFDTYRNVVINSGTTPYTVTALDGVTTKQFDVSVTHPVTSNTMKVGTNFWYHTPLDDNWSGEAAMKPGIDWASAYGAGVGGLGAVNIWNEAWLSELAPYSTLRFMDWANTNWSGITSWSQRMLPTDPANYEAYSDPGSPPVNPGVAYEWFIDLCNRLQKDLWICLPAKADSNYWTQLATLIRDKLHPSRRCYVEYSNETWNGTFSQFQYTIDQGVAESLPGVNQYYQGQSYAVRQSVRIFAAFEAVFGHSAMGSRVVRVFAYGGNLDTGRQALRDVYQSGTHNPGGQVIDMLAMAPYIGSELDGSSPSIETEFHAAILTMESNEIAEMVADRAEFAIARMGTYEGGQHLLANSQMWSENPAIYAEYLFMLDRWSAYFDLFTHYTHTGRWTNAVGQSSWGALDHTGQLLSDAHKYRAIVDWVIAHP